MSDLLLGIADPAVGVVLAGCGSVLCVRRPRSLIGPLMLAAAGCWFLGSIWIVAVFLHRGPAGAPPHLLSHRQDAQAPGDRDRDLRVRGLDRRGDRRNPWVTLAMAVLVAVAAADIYARTSGPARKAGGPALGAALTFASVLALSSANQLLVWENDRLVLLLYDLAICVVALVLSADLLWGRWTEATVADFVTQVGARPDLGTLTGALQRALGDPSVALGYWLPDQHRYVDDAGQSFELPLDDSSRIVIRVEEHGEPVAVLIKDGAVQQDERLLADITAALRLALGNARLRAQVRANITELGIARRRLVEAADASAQAA